MSSDFLPQGLLQDAADGGGGGSGTPVVLTLPDLSTIVPDILVDGTTVTFDGATISDGLTAGTTGSADATSDFAAAFFDARTFQVRDVQTGLLSNLEDMDPIDMRADIYPSALPIGGTILVGLVYLSALTTVAAEASMGSENAGIVASGIRATVAGEMSAVRYIQTYFSDGGDEVAIGGYSRISTRPVKDAQDELTWDSLSSGLYAAVGLSINNPGRFQGYSHERTAGEVGSNEIPCVVVLFGAGASISTGGPITLPECLAVLGRPVRSADAPASVDLIVAVGGQSLVAGTFASTPTEPASYRLFDKDGEIALWASGSIGPVPGIHQAITAAGSTAATAHRAVSGSKMSEWLSTYMAQQMDAISSAKAYTRQACTDWVFHQGQANSFTLDSSDDSVEDWTNGFPTLVSTIRASNPDVHIWVVLVDERMSDTRPFVAELRAAQIAAVAATSNCSAIESTAWERLSDDLHLTDAGDIAQGEDIAACVLARVNGTAPVVRQVLIGHKHDEYEAPDTTIGTEYICFAAAVSAGHTWTYQWHRDGVDISGATSRTYTSVLADSGTNLTCTATPSTGTATLSSNAVSIP